MTKTTQQLATRVLERLKVIAAGESPDDADAAFVKRYYADVFGEMEEDNLTFWEQDSIDDRAFQALADFIAGRVAPDFVNPRPDLEASGRARLQRLASDVPTGFPVSGEYF
jgi:hypothetical protein